MKEAFDIRSITLVIGNGPDWVVIHTDLPSPIWPFDEKANLKLEVAPGDGAKYVECHFSGVPVRLIET